MPCESPCSRCVGTVNNCEACDGTPVVDAATGLEENTRFVSDGMCYADCPVGTVLRTDQINCVDCLASGCEMCPADDLTICLHCEDGMYLHQGVCLPLCPEEFKMDDACNCCKTMTLMDLGFIYFPFLIALFIWTLICLFGLLKKKTKIQKGKRIKVST